MKWILPLLALCAPLAAEELNRQDNTAAFLQEISVTVKSNMGTGSGVIIVREIDGEQVNFVWTAAHVIDSLRSTRTYIDSEGQTKTMVEFRDAQIAKDMIEDGVDVGDQVFDAKVIKYSDSENGEDLALLRVKKKSLLPIGAEFYLEDKIVPVGEELFHVGSLLGQQGANSLTPGIMSQIGRVLQLGSQSVVFDQTTATAFPGSSGGGVFLATNDSDRGKYVGMLVRGAGETFNLIVPVRRMKSWAQRHNLMWALDPSVPMPTLEEIEKIQPDDGGLHQGGRPPAASTQTEFPFLISWPDLRKLPSTQATSL